MSGRTNEPDESGTDGELPGSWLACTLGDVTPYGSTSKVEPSDIPDDAWVLELEDIEKDTSQIIQRLTFRERQSKSTKNHFQAGDVLYGKLRPYLNKVIIADSEGYSTTEIIPLKANAAIDSRYLFYWLKHPIFLDYVTAVSHGLNMPRLGTEAGKAAPFILAPLAEQKRIADKLEAVLGRVDACRARLDRVPALLKRFRQSVLAAATSGQLTENWRTQHSDENAIGLIKCAAASRHHLYKDYSPNSDLPLHEIPDSWAWASLRFILSPDEAFCYGVVQPGENDPSGSLLIRAGDLVGGRVDFSELRRIPRVVHEDYHRSQLKGGEVLVTVVGAGIGTTAIAQPECAGCNIARAVAKLPIRDFNAQFVHCWLSTSRALSWLKHESREVARPTLNLEQLQKLPVPIPPLAEQAEIVRRVEALFAFADRIEARLTAARAQVERLTPATLAKAFRGELVPQDPADEPASALLSRIQPTSRRK